MPPDRQAPKSLTPGAAHRIKILRCRGSRQVNLLCRTDAGTWACPAPGNVPVLINERDLLKILEITYRMEPIRNEMA